MDCADSETDIPGNCDHNMYVKTCNQGCDHELSCLLIILFYCLKKANVSCVLVKGAFNSHQCLLRYLKKCSHNFLTSTKANVNDKSLDFC